MRLFARRSVLIALAAIFLVSVTAPSSAATGSVGIRIVKGGWFFGGQGGRGTLNFGGQTYRLRIGGLSAGLVFGGSVTDFVGTASYMNHPSDIEGIYTAIGAGAAAAGGVRGIKLRNSKGVVLSLTGAQVGLMLNLDLSGMTISLR